MERGPLDVVRDKIRALPEGSFRVTLVTSDSYGNAEMRAPITNMPPLSGDCVPLRMSVSGDAVANLPIFVMSADYVDIYATSVDANGVAVACVPSAPYFVALDEGDRFSIEALVQVDHDTPVVSVATYSRREMLAPPAYSGRIPTEAVLRAADLPARVRIVGFGEPDHGGKDYLEARAAFLLDGARAGRVDKVVLEAGPAEAFALDDYVRGMPVDAQAAVAQLGYWMWDTVDFLSVLDQLRQHNSTHAQKIRIYGADVQRTRGAVTYLLNRRAELGLTTADALLLAALEDEKGDQYRAMSPDQQSSLKNLLSRLASPTRASEDDGTMRLTLVAMALRSRCDYFDGKGMLKYMARELGMASLVSVIGASGPMTVYWAHNGHVARMAASGIQNTGLTLARIWKERYYVVGVFAASGITRAWDPEQKIGVEPTPLSTLPDDHFEAVATKLADEKGTVVIDLHRVPAALAAWLKTPHRARDFGAVFPGPADASRLYLFGDAFDHAIVLQGVTPTVPTATGVRRASSEQGKQ